MKESKPPVPIRFFAGLGLLIVGLLAGILIMLFVVDGNPVDEDRPRIVERVELRSNTDSQASYTLDSSQVSALTSATMLSRSFQEVARRVTPAVVFIRVEVASGGSDRSWFPRFNQSRQSVGSGVIISDSGYIVTNNHVVEGAGEILVTLHDKRQFAAEIVGTDKSTDLAVIKATAASNLPYVTMGNSDHVSVGEWVIAIGNPFRLTSTVTAGIVSALGRQVDIIDDRFGIEDFIQTDAAINPGNSGGALVDLHGNLIGINTAIATESGSYEGYGFAVPVKLVERVTQDLISFGQVKRGYLGVEILAVDASRASELGLNRISGVYIQNIFTGGSADKSGLKEGDVVLSINGKDVDEPNDLQLAVATHRPGDQLTLRVWRDRTPQTFVVELFGEEDSSYRTWIAEMDRERAEQLEARRPSLPDPSEADIPTEATDWGIGLKNLTDRTRALFDVHHGAYVAFVMNGSSAYNAHLPRDVVLIEINGQQIYTVEDALEVLEAVKIEQSDALFQVKREDGQIAFYEVPFVPPTE